MGETQTGISSNEKQKIRVAVVDDHDMVRRGLASYLKITGDIQLVGEAADGEQALQVCESQKPDVVLMDLVMPRMNGIEAIHHIHERFPDIRVIALTSFQDRDMVQEALREGAISYLLKNVTGEDLATAIRCACAGKPTLAPEVAQEFILSSRTSQLGDDLTDREKEVLLLMVEGMSNPEIAVRLTISRSTARAHVSNVLAKLGVARRSEAISIALRNKLVR